MRWRKQSALRCAPSFSSSEAVHAIDEFLGKFIVCHTEVRVSIGNGRRHRILEFQNSRAWAVFPYCIRDAEFFFARQMMTEHGNRELLALASSKDLSQVANYGDCMAGTLKKHLPRLHDCIVDANAKHLCHAGSLRTKLTFRNGSCRKQPDVVDECLWILNCSVKRYSEYGEIANLLVRPIAV